VRISAGFCFPGVFCMFKWPLLVASLRQWNLRSICLDGRRNFEVFDKFKAPSESVISMRVLVSITISVNYLIGAAFFALLQSAIYSASVMEGNFC
jgi:hypothetical protein